MTTENTPNTDQTTPDRRLLLAIVAAVIVLVAAGSLLLLGGSDDESATETAATSEAAVDAPAEAPEVDAPQANAAETDAPETEAPAEVEPAAGSDAADEDVERVEPEPGELVIGQDEEGNDIIVEIEVTGGCAETFHRPLDADSFSFIRWTYEAPGVEPGTPIRVFDDMGFEHFTVVTPDWQIVVEQGITSYGEYPFPILDWNVDEFSSVTIEPQQNHTVDDREGEASKTCLEAFE